MKQPTTAHFLDGFGQFAVQHNPIQSNPILMHHYDNSILRRVERIPCSSSGSTAHPSPNCWKGASSYQSFMTFLIWEAVSPEPSDSMEGTSPQGEKEITSSGKFTRCHNSHINVEIFVCSLCDKNLASLWSLRAHTKIPKGEKNVTCT